MALTVGDLWPQVSGQAALGVEFANGAPGGEIRPFAQIHMMSGVIHGHQGSSGIFRFSEGNANQGKGLQLSFNGGRSFPLTLGYGQQDIGPEGPFLWSDEVLNIQASGLFVALQGIDNTLTHLGGFVWDAIGPFLMDSAAGITIQTNFGEFGNIIIRSEGDLELAAGSMPFDNPKGQLSLSAFNGSGVMEYRFGPHQSWYIQQSHTNLGGPFNDGFFPVPHSGQILQMILQNGGTGSTTLQQAYSNGASVYIGNGNLILNAVNAKTVFGTNGARAAINMSGIFQQFTSNLEAGDLTLLTHAMAHIDNQKAIIPSTQAEANARALGPHTLQFNSGSGLINLSTGSGVGQFFNVTSQAITIDPTGVNFFEIGNNVRDKRYHSPNGASGIVITSPGLYKCTYNCGVEKTAGTTAITAMTYVVKNNIEILGSRSYASVTNITNAINNTSNATFFFDAKAGDVIALSVRTTTTVASNTMQTTNRAINMCFEYIGPPRATQSTLAGE